MNNPDHISESLKNLFWVKKYLNLWCGSGIWDGKFFWSGINIQDPQHWIIVSDPRPPDEIESYFESPSATSITNRLFSCYRSPAAGEDDVIGLERWDAQRQTVGWWRAGRRRSVWPTGSGLSCRRRHRLGCCCSQTNHKVRKLPILYVRIVSRFKVPGTPSHRYLYLAW